jgi:hypothetical protein
MKFQRRFFWAKDALLFGFITSPAQSAFKDLGSLRTMFLNKMCPKTGPELEVYAMAERVPGAARRMPYLYSLLPPNELIAQHFMPPREFLVMTSDGMIGLLCCCSLPRRQHPCIWRGAAVV